MLLSETLTRELKAEFFGVSGAETPSPFHRTQDLRFRGTEEHFFGGPVYASTLTFGSYLEAYEAVILYPSCIFKRHDGI